MKRTSVGYQRGISVTSGPTLSLEIAAHLNVNENPESRIRLCDGPANWVVTQTYGSILVGRVIWLLPLGLSVRGRQVAPVVVRKGPK